MLYASLSTCCHTNNQSAPIPSVSVKKKKKRRRSRNVNRTKYITKKCGCSVFVDQAELVLNINWFSIHKPKAESSRS